MNTNILANYSIATAYKKEKQLVTRRMLIDCVMERVIRSNVIYNKVKIEENISDLSTIWRELW